MRSLINREKALRLSLLYLLKVPVYSLLICILLTGCGSAQKPAGSAAAAPTASVEAANLSSGSAAPSNDVHAGKDPAKGNKSAAGKASAASPEGIIPTAIDIPSLKIKADVISLGLTKDGAMDVPKNDDDVAWFAPGYRPGTPGHAVLAGHVDSKTGPAVFYKLRELTKGDEIILTDKHNKKLKFKVISTAKYPYNDAPLEEIFGPSKSPLLNVITCTGVYSRSKGTHQERLVVTAELIS